MQKMLLETSEKGFLNTKSRIQAQF